MNIMKTFKNFLKSLALFSLILAYSCAGGGEKQTAESGEEKAGMTELLILYPNWAEGIAFTNLAKAALEAHGYEPTIKPIEPGPIYASIAKGDADIFLDAWLPHTHADYWEKYGDNLVKIGESFSNGTTGIVVPSYVTINSIEELNEQKEKFDGEIIGIGSGAGIHRNTQKAIEEYGLDFKQVTSSGPAMMASLKKAVNSENWVAITGWKPHYMWADYDIKYLEDPKGVYPKDVCAIVSRTGFADDYPKLNTFFQNFNLQEQQLYSLMGAIEQGSDAEAAAKEWYESHKSMIDGWF
jgi:glycine betaine/proline transport system substrate-binding protein